MPVGQAVTATMRRRPPAPEDEASGAGVAAAAPGEAAAAGAAAGSAPMPSSRLTRSTTAVSDSARRSSSVKAGLTRARASLVRICRWSASPPAGAAIRKTRSAGPSLAPKSTLGWSRAKASVGSSTPVVRQWGIAIPPARPVAEVCSRAKASLTSCSTSLERPASPTSPASARITSSLDSPSEASRRTSAVVMRSDTGQSPCVRSRSATWTRVGSTWWGWGMVVPGSPAAALP